MTPNPHISVRQAPLGLRRLVEALRLEGQCFGQQHVKILRRYDDIRLPKKKEAKGDEQQAELDHKAIQGEAAAL